MFSEKLRGIIKASGMSYSASFYSCRGVTFSDLNEEHLFKIHAEIKKEFGENASKSFVLMIKEMTDLSASSFLQALEILESNNFNWVSDFIEYANAFPVDHDNPLATLAGTICLLYRNTSKSKTLRQTNSLKFHFLKVNLSEDEYRKWSDEHSEKDIYGDGTTFHYFS